MMIKKLKMLLVLASLGLSVQAQEVVTVQAGDTITIPGATVEEERLVVDEVSFFVPHYYLTAHVGGAYDVGEGSFSQLLSPALQVAVGYQFTEWFSARVAVSGLWARNRYVYPELKYSWRFIQPSVEAVLHPLALFKNYNYDIFFNPYIYICRCGTGVQF